ncbi:MAG: MazG-like family protein [Bacteroidota bacterium]
MIQKNLATAISIEAAELNEIFLWKTTAEAEGVDKNLIKEELADIFTFSLLLAEKHGFNVSEIVLEKIRKNSEKYPIDKIKGNLKKVHRPLMDVISQVDIKPIYRVTGTPENFLTALRYFTWGFNNQPDWKRLYPGDLIFFHCKGSDSKFLKSIRPGILGMGIVGTNFFEDSTPLWIDEKLEGKTYPYRFSFSEICMFSDVPINDDWDSTTLKKEETTKQVLRKLLDNAIPLSELDGFPHMGSYSMIKGLSV